MELEVSCPSCGKSFVVEHDGTSGVADCPHCGTPSKFNPSPKEHAIAHGAPAHHGTDQIHHFRSHANLPVSHRVVPTAEAPKPRGSIMEMMIWLLVSAVGIGLVWWWLANRPPPAEVEIRSSTPPPSAPSQPQPQPQQEPMPAPAKAPVEIALTNPGFEKVLQGWKIVQTAGLVRTMTDAAHSGNRGLRVADDSTERNSIVSYSFPFVPGDEYECRFWARVVSGKGVTVSLQFANAEGAALENSVEVPAGTKQWKEFTVTAKAPNRAVKGEIAIATTEGGTALVDFDDFRLRRTP